MIKISSCQPNELSYEIKPLKHGAFTFALLESLRLQGEGNCATLERLCNRLRNRVKELTWNYHKKTQVPYAAVEPETKYHLLLLPDYIIPNESDLAILKADALKAELEGDLRLAETIWTRLVRYESEEALKALKRIWEKLKEQTSSQNITKEKSLRLESTQSKETNETKVVSEPNISTPSILKETKVDLQQNSSQGSILKETKFDLTQNSISKATKVDREPDISEPNSLQETKVNLQENISQPSTLKETKIFNEPIPQDTSSFQKTKQSNINSAEQIPTLLDDTYQFLETIRENKFRQTYIAQNIKKPGHPKCLIKRLVKLIDDEMAQRLFKKEAKTLRKLQSNEHIPRIIDYFETQQAFYLIQEYIEGNNLTAELGSQKYWQETAVINLLKEILTIVQFVHSQGIIHRDIKPDNLIRRKQDNQLFLIDYGVVKEYRVASAEDPEQVTPTTSFGTPGYMPTEQGRGKPRPSSDIYAVGIIGIQALTRINPQQLPEDPNSGELCWEDKVRRVSEELVAIISKMTRYHFKDRYPSATEALQALEQLKTTGKVSLKSDKKPWKLMALGGGITVFIGMLALVIPFYKYRQSPDFYYKQLETALKDKAWKKADEVNYKLMLRIAGPQSEKLGAFESSEWDNFSCDQLHRIDKLWSEASDGKLGFSAQREIFDSVDRQSLLFYEKIGWKKVDENSSIVEWKYNPITKEAHYTDGKEPNYKNPAKAHLPGILPWYGKKDKDLRFEKIYDCNVSQTSVGQ